MLEMHWSIVIALRGWRTADPSTPLRSGRDDISGVDLTVSRYLCHPDRSEAEWRDLRFAPVSVGHIAMDGLNSIAFLRQPFADFFGDHHRAVLASGAAERDREGALAFFNVVR